MMNKKSHHFLSTIVICLVCINSFGNPDLPDSIRISDIKDLEISIKEILEETNTPAIGIALVDQSGPVWITGMGKANIAKNIDANENTLFRIASVSKMFVALSILKLQEEGKLALYDKVHDLVPEVKFTNQWEDTNPVRIVHLLEHTTGWDEIHLVEIAHNDPTPIVLKEALDFHPHSRISRWVPGTRRAYTNSGYAVAAYIVEKVSGMGYEDYVRKYFLLPLSMKSTTFFNDLAFQESGAVTYNKNMEPTQYRNTIFRPASGMNSSASDMANLVLFFLNRGSNDSLQLISKESISRMEIPDSSPGAKTGLQLGYGLGNFTSIYNGFVYNGHEGTIDGGLTELAYLPEYGIGHVFFINATNSQAFRRISDLLRDFETRNLEKDKIPEGPEYNGRISIRSGYYVPVNPRNQGTFFMDYLIGYEKIEVINNRVIKSWIFPGNKETFIPVSDTTFITENSGKIGMVKAFDPLAGEVLYFDKLVMKHVPGILVFGLLSMTAAWIILTILATLSWMMLFVEGLVRGFTKTFLLSSYVTVPGFLYAVIFLLMIIGYRNPDIQLAKPSVVSISLMILSGVLLISIIWSLIEIYALRNHPINKFIYWQITILACLHFFMTAYLCWFKVIPILTWS